mgnify:CR=1 FL=1
MAERSVTITLKLKADAGNVAVARAMANDIQKQLAGGSSGGARGGGADTAARVRSDAKKAEQEHTKEAEKGKRDREKFYSDEAKQRQKALEQEVKDRQKAEAAAQAASGAVLLDVRDPAGAFREAVLQLGLPWSCLA